ncbi:MAG TPA: hypothetical protein VIO61_16240 [Anaerolineaceae bacterium]
MTVIFFATDVHGSDICWKKFINAAKFYRAEILILGGDLTGKAVCPVIHLGKEQYRVRLLEQTFLVDGQTELQEMLKRIRSRGYYPYPTDPDGIEEIYQSPEKLHQVFSAEVLKRLAEWLDYASQKLAGTGVRVYLSPGNDDMYEVDALIASSPHVTLAEGKVIALDDHHEMISSGWCNPTPWHTYREEPDERLTERYFAMLKQVKNPHNLVLNLHAPPYGSTLDDAAELTEDLRPKYAGNSLVPVGSRAVRRVIEQYTPLLGLFGHIHEGKGAMRIGKTLCINPGSMYEQGALQGALVQLERGKIKNHILTTG